MKYYDHWIRPNAGAKTWVRPTDDSNETVELWTNVEDADQALREALKGGKDE